MNSEKAKLLIIDDEPALLFGLKMVLNRAGYEVITCEDSQQCVQIAIEEHPDLVICDIMMPQMSGHEVHEALKKSLSTRNIPFIFLSARAKQTDKLIGLKAGADDYITKPFDTRELLARINTVLARYEKGKEAGKLEMDQKIEHIRTEIIRNISHELRTPLTQILLSLEMAIRDKYTSPDDLGWLVETAFSQSHRLNSIVDDLIYLSSYESGRTNVLRQQVDIEYSFLQPIKTRHEYYSDKNINIEIYVAPDISIHAPRREFKQAALHLIDNALKFSPPMTTVNIELTGNGIGGCNLIVSDYGGGIPEEFHEKVFERFFQISSGDTRNYGGLGVGLTIARAFARTFDGDVQVLESAQGCRVGMTIAPGPIDSA